MARRVLWEVKQPNVAKETLSFPKRTMENFKEHFNLGGRHADLNLSTEKIVSNVKGFVIENRQALQQGDNTFIGQVNGFDKSIKVYLDGTTVQVQVTEGNKLYTLIYNGKYTYKEFV